MNRVLSVLIALWLLPNLAFADELTVRVGAAFVNVHSGPAKAYPVFHVLVKNQEVVILKSRTGWYKVETFEPNKRKPLSGWIHKEDIKAFHLQTGEVLTLPTEGVDSYLKRDVEVTLMGGVLDNVTAVSGGISWVMTPNLAIDVHYTQAFGQSSDNKLYSIRLRQTFFPEWKLNPYVAIGAGQIDTSPNANLVQSGSEVRTSDLFETGIGFSYYVSESVLFKAEYRGILVLTERDEHERLDQWLIGTSIYF